MIDALLQHCTILERLCMPARYFTEATVQALQCVVGLHTLELEWCDHTTDVAYKYLPHLGLRVLTLRGASVNIAHIPSIGVVERLCIDVENFTSGIPAREVDEITHEFDEMTRVSNRLTSEPLNVSSTPLDISPTPSDPVWSHLTHLQLRSTPLDLVMFPARRFPKLAVLDVSSYETKLPVRHASVDNPYATSLTKIPIRRWFGDNPYTTTPTLSTIVCSRRMHTTERTNIEGLHIQESHKTIVWTTYVPFTQTPFPDPISSFRRPSRLERNNTDPVYTKPT
jgi:hypothetical protein